MAMAVDTKDVEAAEQQLKGMTHSEQHYFNRYVPRSPFPVLRVYRLVSITSTSDEVEVDSSRYFDIAYATAQL